MPLLDGPETADFFRQRSQSDGDLVIFWGQMFDDFAQKICEYSAIKRRSVLRSAL